MKVYVGIDLGSTTTKAVYLDEGEKLLGRGITNSRSNYDVACQIAREEAEIDSRFALLSRKIISMPALSTISTELIDWLTCKYRLAQHMKQLLALQEECTKAAMLTAKNSPEYDIPGMIAKIFTDMIAGADSSFRPNVKARSDFFRDIAASTYLEHAEQLSEDDSALYDKLIGIFDKSILKVEGVSYANFFSEYMEYAAKETLGLEQFKKFKSDIIEATDYIAKVQFEIRNTIGTGYGRQRLPFPKDQIRSEILCHGLGAHYMFPKTTTVLDIGGQDTKAIQIDEEGIVTNFQMNDRCAAGCGRYLGYIADEMNMGVHELGPMAMKSTKKVKINSTCTVFAGTELRERLSLGEKREDILDGLHRAIILRAMSLLARSGGVKDEFTFTGGVAKNPAATRVLNQLVEENYGKMTINISPDSIYTGAIGASLFGKRDVKGDMVKVDLKKLNKRKDKEKPQPSKGV